MKKSDLKNIKKTWIKQKKELHEMIVMTPHFKHDSFGFGSHIKLSRGYICILFDQKSKTSLSLETLKKLINYRNMNQVDQSVKDSNTFIKNEVSYVILKNDDLKLIPLLKILDDLYHQKKKLLIALDGYSASGKSTLSKMLKTIFNGNVFHTDDFFKKMEIDPNNPISMYGNNIDFVKINRTILKPLKLGEDVSYQPFDFKKHQHIDRINISFKDFNIIEGAYSMHPHLEVEYDYKILMKIGFMKAIFRILKRNGFKRLIKFITKWMPKERSYVKHLHIEQKADYILEE